MLDELAHTHKRFDRAQARTVRDFGYGDTQGALAIAEAATPLLTDALLAALTSSRADIARVLSRLEPEVIAVCALQTCFHCIATEEEVRDTCIQLGRNLNSELWARGLVEHDARLAKRVEKAVKRRHGALKYRRQAARITAKRAGYAARAPWNLVECVKAGEWVLNIALETLPDIFVLERDSDGVVFLTITEGALAIAARAADVAMRRSPVFLPSLEEPAPWRGWNKGGPVDPRMQRSTTVIRSVHPETPRLVNEAIASGQMQPALDALNTIQSVPWCINNDVLDVMEQCDAAGIVVPGLPRRQEYALPSRPKPWDDMTDQERTVWKIKASAVKQANRALIADRISFTEDMTIAHEMAAGERFYTPCNMDWRGRVYALPHFAFQREDRVRALFTFADGEPIGEDGLYWLKVHVANCGDFKKISKRPYEERVQWVDQNIDLLTRPPAISANAFWTKADKPFLFLAACLELAAACASGPTFVTRLPVSFDGSCSGLQHLCAMTRSDEGELVNLTDSPKPQDVYQHVADAVAIKVIEDAAEDNALAKCCLAQGITRSTVKRNVMTYSYSSKRYGMSQQLLDDLMQPLALEVMGGERDEHPYGEDDGVDAARYLAGHTYTAIEDIVKRPAQAMAFLQKIARVMAGENKPVSWVTPVGVPWVNRYHKLELLRVVLYLHDRGVRIENKTTIAAGHCKPIDKARAANGVAPNFVHACDGAHLMLTVLAAAREGFLHFALVHDSFGCLASRATAFHRIIREQFVAMYEQHDVLREVLERASNDLEHSAHRLPEPLEPGNLNLKDILNARYAFA